VGPPGAGQPGAALQLQAVHARPAQVPARRHALLRCKLTDGSEDLQREAESRWRQGQLTSAQLEANLVQGDDVSGRAFLVTTTTTTLQPAAATLSSRPPDWLCCCQDRRPRTQHTAPPPGPHRVTSDRKCCHSACSCQGNSPARPSPPSWSTATTSGVRGWPRGKVRRTKVRDTRLWRPGSSCNLLSSCAPLVTAENQY